MTGPQASSRQVAPPRLVDPVDWTERARCRGMDPEPFFGRNLSEARNAIRTCDRCEVREACLHYAVANGIEIGVWGGLTERQRRAHVRRRLAG